MAGARVRLEREKEVQSAARVSRQEKNRRDAPRAAVSSLAPDFPNRYEDAEASQKGEPHSVREQTIEPTIASAAGAPRAALRVSGSCARATLLLVLGTFFWGLSFPLMKNWLDAAKLTHGPGGDVIAGLTLIGLRSLFGVPLLLLIRPRLLFAANRREWCCGLLLGMLNFVACTLQNWGLGMTSPAVSVFFTSLGSAWVPLVAFIGFRLAVAPLTLVGLAVGMAGVAVLGIKSTSDWQIGMGEWLTLGTSVLFAVVIVLMDRLGRTARPGHLSLPFLAASGLPGLLVCGVWSSVAAEGANWPTWTLSMLADPAILRDVALLTIFPTVLSMHWMTLYQPRVSASRAALVYLLEPVFGAALSVAWGHDPLTARLLLGGALILGGNALAELPGWLRERVGGRTENDRPA